MDLWTATKIVARRWYAFLPALLLGLVAVVLIVGSVETKYRAEGRLILFAPQIGEDEAITNSFLDFQGGLGTMVAAIETAALDQQMYLDAFNAGFDGDFTVFSPGDNAILSVQVDTPDGPVAAVEGVGIISKLVQERADRMQILAAAPREQFITMQTISSPVKAQEMNGSKVRVAIALGALAVFGAIAIALLVDGLSRRGQAGPIARSDRRGEWRPGGRRASDVADASLSAAMAAEAKRESAKEATRDGSKDAVKEPVRAETAKAEPAKSEPAKGEPAKTEPAKTEPARTTATAAKAPLTGTTKPATGATTSTGTPKAVGGGAADPIPSARPLDRRNGSSIQKDETPRHRPGNQPVERS